MTITHVFFDIGGVLGTNGWDRDERRAAVEHFGLDPEDFEYRHQEIGGDLEEGRMSLAEYLDLTVFYEPRPFTPEQFVDFMKSQSRPFPESLAIVRALRAAGRVRLMTLNNESVELNLHRIAAFDLCALFGAFFTSCWLGSRKPAPLIYRRALGISQADPAHALFIDDREQNLGPARALGMRTIRFRGPGPLRDELRALGLLD